MSDQPTRIKVFVASPGDVQSERQQLSKVIEELNSTLCRDKDFILQLVRWETDCYPAMGRPQGNINKQIGPYDIFVGIMWKRFGTPTGKAKSGTEEEFMNAYSMWGKSKVPQLLFYFCKAPFMPKSPEEVKQIGKVIDFRKKLSKKGLIWEYAASDDFANVVRPHLARILSEVFKQPQKRSANLLHQCWDNLEPDLQDAFALAYNQSRRDGSNTIRTSSLFAAMMRVKPKPLNELFKILPKDSLPGPIRERSKLKKHVLQEQPYVSGCVADSLLHIGKRASPKRKLSSGDVFVDIAKHGTGSSVASLRAHGVSARKIGQIVSQLGWTVIAR